jgi:hypothetical protein
MQGKNNPSRILKEYSSSIEVLVHENVLHLLVVSRLKDFMPVLLASLGINERN